MTRIVELMQRDFGRPIEEIIKVNNADEEAVYTELTEYVATDRIKAEYEGILKSDCQLAYNPDRSDWGLGLWLFRVWQIVVCKEPGVCPREQDRKEWCERGDSNPHGFPRQILSLVRLPIPPLSHMLFQSVNGERGRLVRGCSGNCSGWISQSR